MSGDDPNRRPGPSPTRWLDRLSEGRFAIAIATPGLLLVGVFVLAPIAAGIGMSFFRIELLRDDLTPFVGLRNYAVRLPADTEFLGTLPLTLVFAMLTSAIAVPLALAAAGMIHGRVRFAGPLSVVLLLPWAVAPIADGILWRLMFEPRTGILTYLLTLVGLPPVVIRDAPGALLATFVAVTWRAIPLLALLFLGALRQVPAEIGRAARLDGASGRQVFRSITLPAIAPVLIAATLLQIILAIQVFEVQYAVSAGAPPKGSMLAGQAIFNRVIGEVSLGYGSAMTMVLGLFTALCLAFLYLILVRSKTMRAPADADDPAGGLSIGRGRLARLRVMARMASQSELLPLGSPRPTRDRQSRGGWARAIQRAFGRLVRPLLAAGLALLLMVCLAGPILWIGIASTQPPSAVALMPPQLTLELNLSGYGVLLDQAWQGAAWASVTITLLATLVALTVALMVGYPLARFGMRWGGPLLLLLLGAMLVPPIALAIPVLFLIEDLGLRDTVLGLVLINAAFWSPILIWLVRGAFIGVPIELERAARVDGCSRLGAIFRVSMPAASPVILAAAAIAFIGIWNDFVFVATLGGAETQTLPRYLGETSTPALNSFAARIVLTVAPCVALVVLLRTRILALR